MKTIAINRAPVLTLCATVVAQRLGFDEDEALTLGRAVAGLNAYSKGRRLGLFKPHEEKAKKARERRVRRSISIDPGKCHACRLTFKSSMNDSLSLGRFTDSCQNGQRKRWVRRFEKSITPNL
jgi:hypothetical protein